MSNLNYIYIKNNGLNGHGFTWQDRCKRYGNPKDII